MAMKTERKAPNQKNSVRTIRDRLFDLTETCNLEGKEKGEKEKKNSTILPGKMRKTSENQIAKSRGR